MQAGPSRLQVASVASNSVLKCDECCHSGQCHVAWWFGQCAVWFFKGGVHFVQRG